MLGSLELVIENQTLLWKYKTKKTEPPWQKAVKMAPVHVCLLTTKGMWSQVAQSTCECGFCDPKTQYYILAGFLTAALHNICRLYSILSIDNTAKCSMTTQAFYHSDTHTHTH